MTTTQYTTIKQSALFWIINKMFFFLPFSGINVSTLVLVYISTLHVLAGFQPYYKWIFFLKHIFFFSLIETRDVLTFLFIYPTAFYFSVIFKCVLYVLRGTLVMFPSSFSGIMACAILTQEEKKAFYFKCFLHTKSKWMNCCVSFFIFLCHSHPLVA